MTQLETAREQIRQRVELTDLVSEHVKLTRRGRELRGLCPFHQEKSPSFFVNPEKGFYRCHGCGAGGDLFKFVQQREGVSFMEAVRLLADRAGIDLVPEAKLHKAGAIGRPELYKVNDWAAAFFHKQLLDSRIGASARSYLISRNISESSRDTFQLGLAVDDPASLQKAARSQNIPTDLLLAADLIRQSDNSSGFYDTFRHRLMFPIRDVTKRCVGFGGRALGDSPAKYLNSSQNALFDKSRVLFGLDRARNSIAQTRRAIVVEGYTDCIAAHQAGFGETVATLGTATTDDHMNTLRRYADTVVLLYDSDAAGEAAAGRALGVALQHGLTVRIARIPSGKDPADFLQVGSSNDFADVLNSSVEALAFKWARTHQRFESSSGGRDRREAIMEFMDLVSTASRFGAVDAIQRGLIANQVGKLLSLPSVEVLDMLNRPVERPAGSARPRSVSSQPVDRLMSSGPELLDGEQGAMTAILAILVTGAGCIDQVVEVFDPDRLSDPVIRRLSRKVWQLRCSEPDASADVLCRLLASADNEEESRALTALADSGYRIPNPEAMLSGAVERLKSWAARRSSHGLTVEVLSVEEGMESRLLEISRSLHANGNQDKGAFCPTRVPASWR